MATPSAPKEVEQLVERFNRNRNSYLAGGINETQLRQEFINPFFSCLGWDIENKQGYAPAYREVIFEDSRGLVVTAYGRQTSLVRRRFPLDRARLEDAGGCAQSVTGNAARQRRY